MDISTKTMMWPANGDIINVDAVGLPLGMMHN